MLACLLSLSLLLSVSQIDSQHELYEQALSKYHSNDFHNALVDFQRLHEETGRSDFLYYIGYCQLNLGSYTDAHSSLALALEGRPDAWEYRLALATALFQLDRRSEAQAEFKRVIEEQPGNVDALYSLGLLASAERDYGSALTYFQKVMELDPLHLGSLYNAGQVSMRMKNTDQARAYLSRHRQLAQKLDRIKVLDIGANLNSSTAYNWLSLANAYLEVAHYPKALEAFQKSLEMDPSLVDVYFHLGLIYSELQQWKESAFSYGKFLESRPGHFEALFNLAQAQRKTGDWEGAAQTLRSASQANPDSTLPLAAMTEILISRQSWDQALETSNSITQRFPGYAQGYFLKAFCLVQVKKLKQALVPARRAVEIEPNQEAYQTLLGQIQQQLGPSP